MQYSIVNYKTVKEDDIFRLDADFYRADYLKYLEQIKKGTNTFLKKYYNQQKLKEYMKKVE